MRPHLFTDTTPTSTNAATTTARGRAARAGRTAAHCTPARQLPPPREARVESDQREAHRPITQAGFSRAHEGVEGGEVVAPGLDVRAREERRRQRGRVGAEQALALVDDRLEDGRLVARVPAGKCPRIARGRLRCAVWRRAGWRLGGAHEVTIRRPSF